MIETIAAVMLIGGVAVAPHILNQLFKLKEAKESK